MDTGNNSVNISFFNRMRRFARDVDSKITRLEALVHAGQGYDSAPESAADEAKRVLNDVATEIKCLKDYCQDSLNQVLYNGEKLRQLVDTTRSVLEKQSALTQLYSDHLNKYGYLEPDEDKENLYKRFSDGEDREAHIKSGLTSVHVYVKDSVPGDFCHEGLLVTPGLFPRENKNAYFCSPTTEKPNDKTFVMSTKKQTNIMAMPEPPPILSSKYALNHQIKIPDEPPLLSRQVKDQGNTIHSLQKAKYHQIDQMTPFPPSPVMMSKLIDRKSAHGIKKINLDDGDDDDYLTETTFCINSKLYPQPLENMPHQTMFTSHGKQNGNVGKDISSYEINESMVYKDSESLNGNGDRSMQLKRSLGMVLPPSPPMLSRKKALVKEIHSHDAVVRDTNYGSYSMQSAEIETTIAVPQLPTVLSTKVDNMNLTIVDDKCTVKYDGISLDQHLATSNPETKQIVSELVRLVEPEEYGSLPEALTRFVSLERMNRYLDLINCYLQDKSQNVLSFCELRDNLGFGMHAKDVIVFMIKLGRLCIHKRSSDNPLYKIL